MALWIWSSYMHRELENVREKIGTKQTQITLYFINQTMVTYIKIDRKLNPIKRYLIY